MLKEVLVPLDGSALSEEVLPYAASLAKGLGARIALLHIIDADNLRVETGEHRAYLDQLQQSAEAAATGYLGEQAKALAELGIGASTAVVYGKPADVLAAFGEGQKEPETLIALSTHGRSGLARVALGSVADRLLRGAHAPLLLIHPRDGARERLAELKRIVVPLDGSPLAEAALPLVTELAKALGLAVTAIWVVQITSQVYGPPELVVYPANLLQELQQTASSYLQRVVERLKTSGVTAEFEVLLHHAPPIAITDYAHDREGTLIAMTTHGRSGFTRWMLGSVTDHVVRLSGAPVLVVRPSEEP